MSARGPVQVALISVLLAAHGRAMTIVELRSRLAEAGFGGLPSEVLYQGLGALVRRGVVAKVRQPGQARTHWAAAGSAALHLGTAARGGTGEAQVCRDIA